MEKFNQRILVLDFGSQYAPLIVRRIRELHVYCELQPYNITSQQIEDFQPSGIILSGGPESVTEQTTARAPEKVFELGCPVLGICYGMQTMAQQLHGKVLECQHREFGYAAAKIVKHDSALLAGIQDRLDDVGEAYLDVWMSHGDHVVELPHGFETILSTRNAPIAGMADEKRRLYALQFHPEVIDTPQGCRILQKFVYSICACSPQWTMHNILDQSLDEIKKTVGDDHVLLALSGGVDSTILAVLLDRAIGKQLICIFVNHGLLREEDKQRVVSFLAEEKNISIARVDAEDYFLTQLKGVTDPEQKRKIIGKLFIDIFEKEAKKYPKVKWLAQGTIYSDVIESAASSHKSHPIKSHHNVAGLPEKMTLNLLEPLRELFKDEVRRLGVELGVPNAIVHQHPFPGPGLAVRILGEVRADYIDILRQADCIFLDELRKHALYDQVSQAFAVFLPVNSVGVVGDARHYAAVISLRAVKTVDFMTARWAHLPHKFLELVSNRIINEVRGISRVVYDISSKPPATIEWE